jgi:polyhydroxyalkanoate synthesis regulator phasin
MHETPAGGPQPPRPGDVAPYVEDERPATLADIRSLRRWLAVAGIWAVAATALGVIALIEANKDDTGDQTAAAGELARVQKQLNSRIDDLESRIDDLPTSDDVSKLDGRLKAVEDNADKSKAAADHLSGRVDDLEGQVDDLETRVEELESSNSGTTTSP